MPKSGHRWFHSSLIASGLGAALVGGLGWILVCASLEVGSEGIRRKAPLDWLYVSFAENLARLSYDLPFTFGRSKPAPDACIVYLDEHSAKTLGQNGSVWDRNLHAQLVRKLSAEGARAVFFDIVFSDSSPESSATDNLAAAIKENGHVFLGAALELDAGLGAAQERVIAPIPELRRVACGWGLLTFSPVDADYGVRRVFTGLENMPSASWRAALHLGAPIHDTLEDRRAWRWVNYYGPANSFPSVDYDRALNGVAPGFFRGRIVGIGSRATLNEGISNRNSGKDAFRNPYGLFGGEFSNGIEVHLTTLLNLLRGEWLTRLDAGWQMSLVLGIGILLGALLPLVRPPSATLLSILSVTAIAFFGTWLFRAHHIWFAWCVPAFVQVPVALVWSVGTRYFIEERRRNVLRNAFAHYLSPQMADRIAAADFDLTPGGVVVEATVMITDLEGFTPLSEQLYNPAMVSQALTQYFTQTARHILGNDGTIINFVGDSLCAVWGAPMDDAEHSIKAVRAAWMLHQDSLLNPGEHNLRTRVGLHTGLVLAGNLGSAERFDYAVVGDTVNFASRLEGLNKYLGTDVLVSDQLKQRIGNEFLTRCVGEFKVVGKKESRVIHELLGPTSATESILWIESFEHGLKAFQDGELDECERYMRETVSLRGGHDGPAKFYLEELITLRKAGLGSNWTGIVQITSK